MFYLYMPDQGCFCGLMCLKSKPLKYGYDLGDDKQLQIKD